MKPDKPNEGEQKPTTELKLLIQETVESRLEKLPATTYKLIEKMVEERVATVHKLYKWAGIILIAAITVTATAFYKVTMDNASAKASDAITKAALGQKLKDVEDAHSQIQNTKTRVTTAGADAMDAASKITAKLQELEKQDNIVRLSHNGNLVLNLQDGELRFRRKNPDKEIILHLDPKGHLQITDGTNSFDPLEGKYLIVNP